jgi:hypothetical protein
MHRIGVKDARHTAPYLHASRYLLPASFHLALFLRAKENTF